MKIGDRIKYEDMTGEVIGLVGTKLHMKWDDNTFGYVRQDLAHLITETNGDKANEEAEAKPKARGKKRG